MLVVAVAVGSQQQQQSVFLSAERVDVANQAGGRREVCCFFFKLQFKEKPKNEAWGPLRRSVRGTKGN